MSTKTKTAPKTINAGSAPAPDPLVPDGPAPEELALIRAFQTIRFIVGIEFATTIVDSITLALSVGEVPRGKVRADAFAARVAEVVAKLLKKFGKEPCGELIDPEAVRLACLAIVMEPYQSWGKETDKPPQKQGSGRKKAKRPVKT